MSSTAGYRTPTSRHRALGREESMETIQEVSPTLDRSPEPDAGTVANPGKPQVRRLRRADSETITITVDGVPMACHAGETVATAILARRCWISFDGRRRGLP